jgi:hypothetical protein
LRVKRGVLRVWLAVVLAAAGAALALVLAGGATAHRSGCHAVHSCPSDHHTYVWWDPRTGLVWDCAEPGAKEVDPFLDTTAIVWEGLTYYCRPAGGSRTTTTPTTPETTTAGGTTSTPTVPPPELLLPNRRLTPGAYNRAVRQSTIGATICVSGWTKRIRPPTSYTNRLKVKQMAQYGVSGSPSDYEEDHFIPLELGGAPKSPKNLWPEPHAQSKLSDPLETKLKREVCKGLRTLKSARAAIRAFKNSNG